MRILFAHPTFPGQFGHISRYLAVHHGDECLFSFEEGTDPGDGIVPIRYRSRAPQRPSGALIQDFETELGHAQGVYEALKSQRATLDPDLIVGHANWGTTLFVSEVFPETPVINYVEYFYRPRGSAIDFRPDFPPTERAVLRHRIQNASVLLGLEACTAAYTPTSFQHGLLPDHYRPKVRVIHDGIDLSVWRRTFEPSSSAGGTPVVTYVSRGLEAMRGFDIFMRVAARMCDERSDVVFMVVGSDEAVYGNDAEHIAEPSLREHVLRQGGFDMGRFRFLGSLPPGELIDVLSLSDLHIYLTVPFVLSWSLLDAMACGSTVLASDTEPVREVIRDGENGLLRGFFDVDALAEAALEVLEDPSRFRHLGEAAEQTVRERYALEVVMPAMRTFYAETASRSTSG